MQFLCCFVFALWDCVELFSTVTHAYSLVEHQNDLELDFKVFFFVDSCCVGILLDESN